MNWNISGIASCGSNPTVGAGSFPARKTGCLLRLQSRCGLRFIRVVIQFSHTHI